MKLPATPRNQQYADQTAKGGVLGIITYLAMKYSVDPALMALSMPLLAAGLSYLSTLVGDAQIASFIGVEGDRSRKPVKVAAKKSPAKKTPAKKK